MRRSSSAVRRASLLVAVGWDSGSVTVNVAPSPGTPVAVMWPPWRQAILRAIERPMPGALVLGAAVQALERGEDPLGVLLVEADAVVLDGDHAPGLGGRLAGEAGPLPGDDLAANPDERRLRPRDGT